MRLLTAWIMVVEIDDESADDHGKRRGLGAQNERKKEKKRKGHFLTRQQTDERFHFMLHARNAKMLDRKRKGERGVFTSTAASSCLSWSRDETSRRKTCSLSKRA